MKQTTIDKMETEWTEFLQEDENIYSEHSREEMIEDDELSTLEAAFMEGYEEAE